MTATADAYLNVAAAITVALIGAVSSIYVARRDKEPERPATDSRPVETWKLAVLVPAVAVLILVSLATLWRRGEPGQTRETLRYTFDNGLAPLSAGRVLDAVGRRTGEVVGPGRLSLVGHRGAGDALKFPPPCTTPENCPRVIVEIIDAEDLNPDGRDFSYGADVLVEPTESGSDSTILEKGLPNGESTWKLKIEASGKASCVVVTQRREVSTARTQEAIADGEWHRIDCRKTATALTIAVNGVDRGRVGVPAGGVVRNENPLRLGGYRLHQNNNQFYGAVDDVYFRVRDA